MMNNYEYWNLDIYQGQTHSNNPSAKANKLFECVGPFWGVGA